MSIDRSVVHRDIVHRVFVHIEGLHINIVYRSIVHRCTGPRGMLHCSNDIICKGYHPNFVIHFMIVIEYSLMQPHGLAVTVMEIKIWLYFLDFTDF